MPTLHVHYWLNPHDVQDYSPAKLRKFDSKMENEYVSDLQYRCQSEAEQQRQMIYDAQGFFSTNQHMMEQARNLPMKSCKRLDELKLRRG